MFSFLLFLFFIFLSFVSPFAFIIFLISSKLPITPLFVSAFSFDRNNNNNSLIVETLKNKLVAVTLLKRLLECSVSCYCCAAKFRLFSLLLVVRLLASRQLSARGRGFSTFCSLWHLLWVRFHHSWTARIPGPIEWQLVPCLPFILLCHGRLTRLRVHGDTDICWSPWPLLHTTSVLIRWDLSGFACFHFGVGLQESAKMRSCAWVVQLSGYLLRPSWMTNREIFHIIERLWVWHATRWDVSN
jgi:hypothetical protein